MNETLETRLETLPGAAALERRAAHELWMTAPALDVTALAALMLEQGARLSTMTALALTGGETEVIYHYILGQAGYHLRVQTRSNCLPSVAPITAAADWIEREIMDLFAVTFIGHPNPARLLRPAQLEAGYFREPGGAAGKAARGQQD
jgi:Ni,Fe-hydrogenase III component G